MISYDLNKLQHEYEVRTAAFIGPWDLKKIRAARDAHLLGHFARSARLADALCVDPRVFAPLLQRLSPPMGLPIRLKAASKKSEGKALARTVRDESELLFCRGSSACPIGVRMSIFRSIVMMGVWIGQKIYTPRADGSRVDVVVKPWPMREATWNEGLERYQVFTTEGIVTIEPDDPKWIVIEPHGPQSFVNGAVGPIALTFADRQYAIRDRSNHSEAHGAPKLLGTPPEDIGPKTDEGKDFEKLVKGLYGPRAGGIKPFGSTIEYLELKGLAYKEFDYIIDSSNNDIVMVLLGQNGTSEKGGVYTPPSFEGVRFDYVEMDINAVADALTSQLLKQWTHINWGRDDVAAELGWLVPDLRAEARVNEVGQRHEGFNRAISAYKANGFDITSDVIEQLAREYSVTPIALAPKPLPSPADPGAVGGTPLGDVDQLPPSPTETQQQTETHTDEKLAAE